MAALIPDPRAADALRDGISPIDHFGMMAWCQANIDDFATMGSADRHAYASRVQVMLALLPQQAAAIPAQSTMDADMGDDSTIPLETEQRETPVGLDDHVSESVLTIARRIMQTIFVLPLDLCNHTILTAWCIINVDGFADSDAQARRQICDAVAQHLVQAKRYDDHTEEEDRSGSHEDEDEYFETKEGRGQRLEDEAWYNNVEESNTSIADRFPYQELNYSDLLIVTAWCTIGVDGFVESGHSARWAMATAVQEILEERYGDWEKA